MIQIDDAGSGSFVGGTCIGFYRPETNEYYFDIIPVELYNEENFKRKLYLDEVVAIAEVAFRALKVGRNETIEVCRGYMFEKLKLWLAERNYFWYGTQITGHVQEIVEKNFELYAVKLGLPKGYIKYTGYPFHFHKLLRWVFADYENRIGLCKIGWKSWRKLQDIRLEESRIVNSVQGLFCLRCGKRIKKGSTARVLSYISNKKNYIFIHESCSSGQPLRESPHTMRNWART